MIPTRDRAKVGQSQNAILTVCCSAVSTLYSTNRKLERPHLIKIQLVQRTHFERKIPKAKHRNMTLHACFPSASPASTDVQCYPVISQLSPKMRHFRERISLVKDIDASFRKCDYALLVQGPFCSIHVDHSNKMDHVPTRQYHVH